MLRFMRTFARVAISHMGFASMQGRGFSLRRSFSHPSTPYRSAIVPSMSKHTILIFILFTFPFLFCVFIISQIFGFVKRFSKFFYIFFIKFGKPLFFYCSKITLPWESQMQVNSEGYSKPLSIFFASSIKSLCSSLVYSSFSSSGRNLSSTSISFSVQQPTKIFISVYLFLSLLCLYYITLLGICQALFQIFLKKFPLAFWKVRTGIKRVSPQLMLSHSRDFRILSRQSHAHIAVGANTWIYSSRRPSVKLTAKQKSNIFYYLFPFVVSTLQHMRARKSIDKLHKVSGSELCNLTKWHFCRKMAEMVNYRKTAPHGHEGAAAKSHLWDSEML